MFVDKKEFNRILNNIDIERKYTGILCPLRGGFYISKALSIKYRLPLYFIEISSYKNKKQGNIEVLYKPNLPAGKYLICDDIFDTGKTIKTIESLYENCKFDCVFLVSKDENQLAGEYVDKETWVTFWWENERN